MTENAENEGWPVAPQDAEPRPVDQSDDSSKTEPIRLVPKLVIELGGERGEFLAHAKPNQWALMQQAKAVKGDPGEQTAAMYSLAISSVLVDDRPRFEDFMTDHGHDETLIETLSTALNALWEGDTMLPLASTSSPS